MFRTRPTALAFVLFGCAVSTPNTQDSVSAIPGTNDAPYPFGPQHSAYVVDLAPAVGSWGNVYALAPFVKATADPGGAQPTALRASTAISQTVQTGIPQGTPYAVWFEPGIGINPSQNTQPTQFADPGSVGSSFAVAFTDISAVGTHGTTAVVSLRFDEPNRLYVRRAGVIASRLSPFAPDTTIPTLSGVSPLGMTALRLDSLGADATDALAGNSLIAIDALARTATPNVVSRDEASLLASDSGATTPVVDQAALILSPPALVPTPPFAQEGGGFPPLLSLDFSGDLRVGNTVIPGHLAMGLTGHRGGPTIIPAHAGIAFADLALVASLATTADGATDAINLVGLSGTPGDIAVSGTVAAVLPQDLQLPTGAPIGRASFGQYLSQEPFIGPRGVVALSCAPPIEQAEPSDPTDPSDPSESLAAPDTETFYAAAVATSPQAGEFIALATIQHSEPTWSVVAAEGSSVLDGPMGAPIGEIVAHGPVTFSAPAVDSASRVMFTASYQPTGGSEPLNALFRAVPMASGYSIERLIEEGQVFAGLNAGTSYTLDTIRLGDADSVAPGAFHAGQFLASGLPARSPSRNPLDMGSFAAVVNVVLTYDTTDQPERYDASLLVTSFVASVCSGDVNNDGLVDADDFFAVIANFGSTGGGLASGDLNGDNVVNADDFFSVIMRFGSRCVSDLSGPAARHGS